jgi:Zn-dependent peptidase ImmA (M78 family)
LSSVQRTLEELGVHVAFVDFESDEIEAASLFETRAAPVVLLNARVPRIKQILSRRAVLAHELCHLLHDGGERDLTVVSRETDQSPQEQRANGFAPSFLAPGKFLRDEPRIVAFNGRPREVVLWLARTWGLSFAGAVWHAKNTHLIEGTVAEELYRNEHATTIDPSPFETETDRATPSRLEMEAEPSPLASGLFSSLALAALERGLISRGRALELLTFE